VTRGSTHRADAALACDYYDQSHMINEFKAYTGKCPCDYAARNPTERVLGSLL
jgi:AraC-like DNA-binding protein